MLKPTVYFALFLLALYIIYWAHGSIRRLPPYSTFGDKVWHVGFRLTVWAILLFLITPILVILPLSFNSEPYFTYPMPGFSLRWYEDFLVGEGSAVWGLAIKNSVWIAFWSTAIAGESPSTWSTSGFSIRPRNWRA